MKKYIVSFIFSAMWFLLVFWFFSNYYWYRRIALESWGFIIVNLITLFPVLLVLYVADRMQPAGKTVSDSKPDPKS
ncbi:hypothetical protein AB4Z29_28990 [Paenibacillus sp. 2TAB23]|uniref:hypothetical protein n=1 Tax=Paenibacillus sp. 2TAB23 TaxID=3233004 RepID=UPI003F9485D7